MKNPLIILSGAVALCLAAFSARADDNLAPNGGFEKATEGNDWPAGWAKPKAGAEWGKEGENRFLSLKSTGPGEMVMLYQEFKIPEGVEALEFTWKQRITGLKKGAKSWFDARIMVEFSDAERKKLPGAPKAPNSGKDTNGWEEKRTAFLVPEGAVYLRFMPALFQVEAGTFDLDDISFRKTDPVPLREAAAKAAAERAAKLAAEAAARRAKATAAYEKSGVLIANGDFEADAKRTGWPDGWGKPKGASWGDEEGNRFIRMTSSTPGEMVSLYHELGLPEGPKALELSWRQRVTDLKTGEMPWFDARIILEFKGADGKALPGKPEPAYTQKNTDGWVERRTRFLVPEEAHSLVVMPALFQVKAGTFDIDDIQLKPTAPEPLIEARKAAEELARRRQVPAEEAKKGNWPKELKVAGNRLVDPDGNEVWLQGVNIPSLEWSVAGESVLRSTIVAIEDWKSNALRLPVKEEYWFGKGGGQTDGGEAYRKLVDQVIMLAANRGVYVILDLHRYRAPRQEYLDFWKEAAAKYKNHPALIFDLINEPHGISWEVWRNGGFVEEAKKEGDEDAFLTEEEKKANKRGFVSPGMQAMLETVRATGAKNVVVAGGLDWAYDLSGIVDGYALVDETGNGVMYASHIYPWKNGWQKKVLDAAALYPILVGEVGADEKKMTFMPLEGQEDAETWVPEMLGLIQKHRLNWTGWSFHPHATPRMLMDWEYTPSPFWGKHAKDALSGKQFEVKKLR